MRWKTFSDFTLFWTPLETSNVSGTFWGHQLKSCPSKTSWCCYSNYSLNTLLLAILHHWTRHVVIEESYGQRCWLTVVFNKDCTISQARCIFRWPCCARWLGFSCLVLWPQTCQPPKTRYYPHESSSFGQPSGIWRTQTVDIRQLWNKCCTNPTETFEWNELQHQIYTAPYRNAIQNTSRLKTSQYTGERKPSQIDAWSSTAGWDTQLDANGIILVRSGPV